MKTQHSQKNKFFSKLKKKTVAESERVVYALICDPYI